MSIINKQRRERNNLESNDTLRPNKIILIIALAICILIAIYLTRTFLLANQIVVLGLILTTIGSLALTQER